MVGLTSILREAWNTATNTEDKREKIQSLSLAKDCYAMKLELLTNATVVDDAIRFVEHNKQQPKERSNLFSLSSKSNDTESEREPEYSQKEVIVSIKDTGRFIHPEIFPRLFSKFAAKSETGTGLGLFISKSIIEKYESPFSLMRQDLCIGVELEGQLNKYFKPRLSSLLTCLS
jgi:nitrogen fixation/metabolism regulation signal transduction histidine kinase